MALEQQAKEVEKIAGDRRHNRRYEIHLDLRWKLVRRKRVLETGTGRTVDLSSGGILIEADRQLPVGLNVEVSLAWPVMLHNVAPMQLVISGRIVRSAGQRVAIRMVQHEFRTAGTAVDQRNVLTISSRAPTSFRANANMAFSKAT